MNVLRMTKWAEFSEVCVNRLNMLARTFLKMSCFSKMQFADILWWVLDFFYCAYKGVYK